MPIESNEKSTENCKISIDTDTALLKYKDLVSKRNRKLESISMNMQSLFENFDKVKQGVSKYDLTTQNSKDCVYWMEFFLEIYQVRKSIENTIYNIQLNPETCYIYFEAVRYVEFIINILKTEAPFFPPFIDYIKMQSDAFGILNQHLSENITSILKMSETWANTEIKPTLANFYIEKEFFTDLTFIMIVSFLKEFRKNNDKNIKFINRRIEQYKKLIAKMESQINVEDSNIKISYVSKSRYQTNRKLRFQEETNFKFENNYIDSMQMVLSPNINMENCLKKIEYLKRLYAISIIIINNDIDFVKNVYLEITWSNIISSLYAFFLMKINAHVTELHDEISDLIKSSNDEEKMNLLKTILQILCFLYENQHFVIENAIYYESITETLLLATIPLEKLYFMIMEKLQKYMLQIPEDLTNKGIYIQMINIFDIFSTIQDFKKTLAYTHYKKTNNMIYINMTEENYSEMQLFYELIFSKMIRQWFFPFENITSPQKLILLINHVRLQQEFIEVELFNDILHKNMIKLFHQILDTIIDHCFKQYQNYWQNGLKYLLSLKDNDSLSSNEKSSIAEKKIRKKLLKIASEQVNEFLNRVSKEHKNIIFYVEDDKKYLLEMLKNTASEPYTIICDRILKLNLNSVFFKYFKYTSEEFNKIIQDIFI